MNVICKGSCSEIPNNCCRWKELSRFALQSRCGYCPWLSGTVAYSREVLEGSGTVSHQEAIEKAEREFEIYREREMRLLESDFDKAVKRLKNMNDDGDSTQM